MLRFRLALLTLILLTCSAAAATGAGKGHEADYTMVMSMDGESFGRMFSGLDGMEGLPEGSDVPDLPDMQDSEVMHGKVFWDKGHSRVDMYYNPQAAPGMLQQDGGKLRDGDLVESFIIYTESGQAYRLLHGEKRAVMYENINARSGLNGDGGGIPDIQPDRMINNYKGMVDSLRGTEGMTVTELDPARVNGYPVRGVSFVMDMQEMLKGMDGTNGMPDLSALGELGTEAGSQEAGADSAANGDFDMSGLLQGIMSMLGNVEGEIWYSDELAIVMRMHMELMGISTTMELDSVFDWQDKGDTFVVPDGYELITEQDYMKEQQQKMDEMMKQTPGGNKPAKITKRSKGA